jgi:integral membrane protein (TIGR00529 family)
MLDLLKLAGILALIILLLRLKWNLGLVLLLASVLTGLIYGRALDELALDTLSAAVDALTLRLVAIVLLITFLGGILRSTLQLEGLIRAMGDLFVDRRWLLPLMPTIIGLLPMVGGAMFSAPMVEEASQGLDVSPERRTFVNYWFRHPWESIFPLYPSLILAAGLMGVSPQELTITQWPIFVASVVGGVLFGLVGIKRGNTQDGSRPGYQQTLALLLKSIWPIVLVLALSVLFDVDLILSLVVTIVVLIAVQRQGPRQLWAVVKDMPLGTVPIILGAMIFRRVLETSQAIEVASEALASMGIPLAIVVFSVPLLSGILTGLAVAAFAIGFPIVFPLCGPDLMASGYGLLAYAGGFVGLMLSPVHLCLALTRVYFKAGWGGVYQRLLPAAALVAISAVVVFLVRY